ncbi:hypothetical protein [Amycolatopsis sp. NPDC051903]|uniref:hypothetical protein n=1 Tax=Amycolatopsis sp. NPDC051903 TaxID=3363936 RepID=UPI00378B4211
MPSPVGARGVLLGGASAPPMAAGVRRYAARVGAEVQVLEGQQHFAMVSDPASLAAAIMR